jgi:hypothetical protein
LHSGCVRACACGGTRTPGAGARAGSLDPRFSGAYAGGFFFEIGWFLTDLEGFWGVLRGKLGVCEVF